MRKFLVSIISVILACGFFVSDASAKRFGGGKSFGAQRSHNSFFSSHKSHRTPPKMRQANKSKWGGILGGMLIGGLLASLFMGHGIASGLMTWLLLGVVILFILSLFRKKMSSNWQFATPGGASSNFYNEFTQPTQNHNDANTPFSNYPANYAEEDFLRCAKVTFFRLQTAYDQKNMVDIQSFTTPEVFAEIKMQLQERGDEPNITEVIHLNAKTLDISEQGQNNIASVHFTGTIKENDEHVTNLNEIWHFYQPENSSQWLVGGIDQANN